MSLPPASRFPWMDAPDDDEDELDPRAWCPVCDRAPQPEGCPACGDEMDDRRMELWG